MKNKYIIVINEDIKIKQLEEENKLLRKKILDIELKKEIDKKFLLTKCNYLENKLKYFKQINAYCF